MDTNILVVDIEATCWNDKEEAAKNTSEIIEIGACLLNTKTLLPGKKDGIFIRPVVSSVSKFCTELTTITQKQLDDFAVGFDYGCNMLEKDFDSKKSIWASYGGYDKTMFEKQCYRMNIAYPFMQHHINVKDMVLLATGKSMGMASALKYFGLNLVGTHHRGVDDAYNIANILAVLIQRLRNK